MSPSRRPVAAVIGAGAASVELAAAAHAIGEGLVHAGFRIATGGLRGVMAAASEGARRAAGDADGRVIAVLPGLDASAANPHADIIIPTGMNIARNFILVSMADVVVAVGGGSGTLSEIALAWQLGKPLIALDIGDGWSARLAGQSLDSRRPDHLHRATTPDEVVSLARQLTSSPT